MNSSSLHPEPVRAACKPRGRFAFGLTPRTIWLLAAGLLLALPGFFRRTWGYGMLVWDALVLLAAILDGLRLPAAQQITIERSWSNAPSLDSETEIQLAVDHSAETILECHLVDDLPDALVAAPATHLLRAFPRVRATLRYKIEPRERGDVHAGQSTFAMHRRSDSWSAGPWRRSSNRCASIRRCARAKISRFFSRAAGRSISSCAACASADWAATSRACASISRATICATYAGRPQRGAAS